MNEWAKDFKDGERIEFFLPPDEEWVLATVGFLAGKPVFYLDREEYIAGRRIKFRRVKETAK